MDQDRIEKKDKTVELESPDDSKKDVSSNEQSDFEMIKLPDGQAFLDKDAFKIMRNTLARVIVLAGPTDSGKTTLLSTIYDSFNSRDFAGYIFAGSLTLLAFEKRCHLARIESNAVEADTLRTRREGKRLLHLRVKSKTGNSPCRDLLFTDYSGEFFQDAIYSTELCKKLMVAKRADHFVLFLDCKKLADSKERHRTREEGRKIIRRFLESEMIGKNTILDVLFSKFDLLQKDTIGQKFIEEIEKEYEQNFREHFADLLFERVSALKVSESIGLDSLFPRWVEESRLFIPSYSCDFHEDKVDGKREFYQYLWKRKLKR